jgi:hypothetical protein
MKCTDLPGLALYHDAIFPVSGPELNQMTTQSAEGVS